MIDWHNHILPALDDGSKDVAESITMMEMQTSQGVKTVIATPHFYANDQSVETFIKRRRASLQELEKSLGESAPEIILGAEVKYYQGISRMEDLKELQIEGTKLLLLEMPTCRWTEYMVRELIELSGSGKMQVVLAHVERYLNLQNQKVWERIFENGILIQTNASFFTSLSTRRRAIRLLKEGKIHFVGSDCHNTTTRPPKIGTAYNIIEKKLGREYLSQMFEFGYSKLG